MAGPTAPFPIEFRYFTNSLPDFIEIPTVEIQIKELDLANIPEIMALERLAWPEDIQASEDQIQDRLRVFAEGFLGAFVEGELVGMASSQIIQYSLQNAVRTWTDLTADGWIGRTHRSDGNCLHCVSICVSPRVRSQGIGKTLSQARLALGKRLGLGYVLTDARLPALARYLGKIPAASAEQYVEQIVAGQIREPVVNMYLTQGFCPVGLIPHCMRSDEESAHYGLALLKRLEGS